MANLACYKDFAPLGLRMPLIQWPRGRVKGNAGDLLNSCGLRSCVLVAVVFLAWVGMLRTEAASSVTASLDSAVISLGESATLSLTYSGEAPDQPAAVASPPGLNIAFAGQASNITIINGRASSTVTHNYQVTPSQPGDYVIPVMQIPVRGQVLTTQPVRLTVLKSRDTGTVINSLDKLAFVRLVVPKNSVYVGETFPVEVHLYVTAGEGLQMPQLQGDGFVLGAFPQPTQSQVQVGGQLYTRVVFQAAATAVKTGSLTLGPAQVSLVLRIRQTNRRGRDPFSSFPDPFDLFDLNAVQRRPVTLSSEPQLIRVLPLPDEGKPADFTGAVGNFTMTVNASPTNVVVGDPITLKVAISGRGAMDSLTLPGRDDWRDFKTYPPTSKVANQDPLGLAGLKTFEQVVIPQNVEVKELPAIAFSYFDPEQKAYRTLRRAPIPLSVRPGSAAQPQPTVLANASNPAESPPPRDIVHIKPQPGVLATIPPPLIRRSWFLAVEGLPLLLWLTALVWRKREDALANDPRLRRRRHVAETVRTGFKELPRLASQNQSEEFFAAVFRLVQEQLGERLDLPASAITEAVLDERLRARADERLLAELHELFQICNQARYAPQHSPQELISLVPRVEAALRQLQKLPDECDAV